MASIEYLLGSVKMSLGQELIDAIEKRRDRQRKNQPGAVGQFWRDGGNQLLY